MRPIKFRAWDKEAKHFHYGGTFFDLAESVDEGNKFWYFGLQVGNHPDDIELMQFTGLLDKNGKEIYEGDIVRLHCFNHNLITATIEWLEDYARFTPNIHDKKIKVDGGTSHGKMESMRTIHSWSGMHSCFAFPRYIEVIGNIYENKNLLK